MRYDLYAPIHKVVRSELSRISVLLGNTDFEDKADVEKAEKDFNIFIKFLSDHNDQEEKFIHPLLTSKAPNVLKETENAHIILDKLINDLNSSFSETKSMPFKCHQLYLQFNEFASLMLKHLNEEERQVMPELQKHYTDEELIKVRQAIMQSHSPQEFVATLKLMLPLLNHRERVGIFNGMKHTAPPHIFETNCRIAANCLPKAESDKLFSAMDYKLPASVTDTSGVLFQPVHK